MQAWGSDASSDASVLLLLVSVPYDRNLLAQATKLLRDSLDAATGQLAVYAAVEELVDQSVSLIYRPISASSNGHGDQSIGRKITGDFTVRTLSAAVDTYLVSNRENSGFDSLA